MASLPPTWRQASTADAACAHATLPPGVLGWRSEHGDEPVRGVGQGGPAQVPPVPVDGPGESDKSVGVRPVLGGPEAAMVLEPGDGDALFGEAVAPALRPRAATRLVSVARWWFGQPFGVVIEGPTAGGRVGGKRLGQSGDQVVVLGNQLGQRAGHRTGLEVVVGQLLGPGDAESGDDGVDNAVAAGPVPVTVRRVAGHHVEAVGLPAP